jgi:hypothetical protein
MPGTRRTPIARSRAPLITAQTVDLFRTALQLHKRDPASLETHNAKRQVDRLVGWKMWKISIWDFDDIYSREVPPQDPHLHDEWAHALELRQALEQAVRELRAQERAARAAQPAEPERESQPEPTPPPSS